MSARIRRPWWPTSSSRPTPAGRKAPRVRALDGLTVEVPAGTVFALLGPNGAGKSTTVKILTTLSRPDAGSARVAGLDVLRRSGRRPARHRPRLAEAVERPDGHRAREPRARGPHPGPVPGRRPGPRPGAPGPLRARPTPPAGSSRPGRAACPASSTSRSASCTARRCSSSTSPPPVSTRRPAPRCGPRSRGCPPASRSPCC